MTPVETTLYWTLCATEDALRVLLFWRLRPVRPGGISCAPLLRWWCLLTGCAQAALDVLGYAHLPLPLYDYAWRTESLLALAGLVLVCWSAVSSERQPPAAGPTGNPPPAIGGPAVSAVLTVGILAALHHHPIWPGYWLEPVFVCIAGVNLWCGLLIVLSGRWAQCRVLGAWCLLTGCLYSGAALSIMKIGLAGEILNCIAMAGFLILA